MKNYQKSILAILCFLFPLMGSAQYAGGWQSPRNIVKVELSSFLLQSARFQYERVFNDRFSAQLGGAYTFHRLTAIDELKFTLSGFEVSPELRYYFSTFQKIYSTNSVMAPVGIYTGIWADYKQYRAEIGLLNDPEQSFELLSIQNGRTGMMLGWQFWLKVKKQPIIMLDVQGGLGYSKSIVQNELAEAVDLISLLAKNGIVSRLRFSVGYAF